jgi:hypothetical protein
MSDRNDVLIIELQSALDEAHAEVAQLTRALRESHARMVEMVDAPLPRTMIPTRVSANQIDVLATRTFRWSRPARRIYAKIRFGDARRVPPSPARITNR